MTTTDLTALLARVEAATGADRELDGRLAYALGWRFNGFGPTDAESETYEPTDADFRDAFDLGGHWKQPGGRFADISDSFDPAIWPEPPEWTASLDAALALCERVLPGVMWLVGFDPDDGSMCGRIVTAAPGCVHAKANHDTAPLAIITALLKAKLSLSAQDTSDAHDEVPGMPDENSLGLLV